MTENAVRTQQLTVVVTGAVRSYREPGGAGRAGDGADGAGGVPGPGVRLAGPRRCGPRPLRDAAAAYPMYPSDVGSPAAAEAIGALAREAVGLGVGRLVLLSARGEDQAVPTEAALQAWGADWTIVRATSFSQDFSEGPLVEGLCHGELVFPAREVREPLADVRDIADVVVAVLTSGDRCP